MSTSKQRTSFGGVPMNRSEEDGGNSVSDVTPFYIAEHIKYILKMFCHYSVCL